MKTVETKKRRKIFVAYVVFTFVLILSSVVLTVFSTIKGSEISYLEKERQKAKLEYEELSSKVVSQTSLSQIIKASEYLGLGKPQTFIYLETGANVASAR